MRMSTPRCSMCVAKLCRSECGRNLSLKPHLLRALLKANRAVASGRWVTVRRLGNNHLLLRWVFQTSRSISTIDSVNGSARSLFRLPMTRRIICWESTAVTGSVTASPIRNPYA